MSITEFLLARIAEDEDELKTARIGDSPEWWEPAQWYRERGLAECAAKRAIIDHAIAWSEDSGGMSSDYTLRVLAAIYANHDDYNPGWAL